MIRKIVFGFIILQASNVYSVDMRSILKKSYKKVKAPRQVSFEKKDEKLIEAQKTESFVSCFDRSRHAFKEDLDCCMDCGQILRFSIIGCCLFGLGYSYGSADCCHHD